MKENLLNRHLISLLNIYSSLFIKKYKIMTVFEEEEKIVFFSSIYIPKKLVLIM
jgi:hypothetical protein